MGDNPQSPKALLGFSHVDRYWDRAHDAHAAKILPGEYYVTANDEVVVTVLGSCVAACIRDPVCNVGGMNHFLLPSTKRVDRSAWANSEATRYGSFAMERLINDILKYGGERKRLEVKLFGGARILSTMTDIGAQNIEFAREYMEAENLKVVSEDVGAAFPRKVYYFARSGRVRLKKLKALHNDTIQRREIEYSEQLRVKPTEGDVELF